MNVSELLISIFILFIVIYLLNFELNKKKGYRCGRKKMETETR